MTSCSGSSGVGAVPGVVAVAPAVAAAAPAAVVPAGVLAEDPASVSVGSVKVTCNGQEVVGTPVVSQDRLGALPYFSVRYRATGALGRITYAVWLGDDPGGQGQSAFIPLQAGDLVVDGRWHTYTQQLTPRFIATQLAILSTSGWMALHAPATYSSV